MKKRYKKMKKSKQINLKLFYYLGDYDCAYFCPDTYSFFVITPNDTLIEFFDYGSSSKFILRFEDARYGGIESVVLPVSGLINGEKFELVEKFAIEIEEKLGHKLYKGRENGKLCEMLKELSLLPIINP